MIPFPSLILDDWRPTRDRLWACARLLGKVRGTFTPPQRHWSHISLRFDVMGPSTGPIQAGVDRFGMGLDLVQHRLTLRTSASEEWSAPIAEVSTGQVLDALAGAVGPEVLGPLENVELPALDVFPGYEPASAEGFLAAMGRIDSMFRIFRGRLHGEASSVQLWPHHFDLAVLWMTGRQVPGVDPSDENQADESANFGFSTGDEGIPAPYFYATTYPPLPPSSDFTSHPGSVLHQEGWRGVRMDYARLMDTEDPEEDLLGFLTSTQAAFAAGLTRRAEEAGPG